MPDYATDASPLPRPLRPYRHILYGIALMIIVSVILGAYTLFVMSGYHAHIANERQLQGQTIAQTTAAIIEHDAPEDRSLWNDRLSALVSGTTHIHALTIITRNDDGFVTTHTIPEESRVHITDEQQTIAWSRNRTVATPTDEGRMSVITPIVLDNTRMLLAIDARITEPAAITRHTQAIGLMLGAVLAFMGLVIMVNTRMLAYAGIIKRTRALSTMKRDLISIITHELRAPISAINGYLALYLEGAYGEPPQKAKEVMETTAMLAGRLNTGIGKMGDILRAESGEMEFDMQDISVEDIIEKIIAIYTPAAERKGLTLTYEKESTQAPIIHADAHYTERILEELTENAIRYTETGTVMITIKEAGNTIDILVTDTGVGIPSTRLEFIQQPFSRLRSESGEMTRSGMGMGLWLVKVLTKAMQGTFHIESAEGVGTKAGIRFSAVYPDEMSITEPNEEGSQTTPPT